MQGPISCTPVQSLEQLAESEHRFRSLVEALPDAILVHTKNKVVFANPFCVQLLGAKTEADLIGRVVSDFVVPEYLPRLKDRVEYCYATGRPSSPAETTLIGCDGSRVDVEAVAIPTLWNGNPAIEVVLRDIRTRKQAQNALDESHKRLQLAAKAGLRIGLWDWDTASNTVLWSQETFRQFGLTPEVFSGKVADAVSRIHPEDASRVQSAIEKVLQREVDEYAQQYRVVRPDGTICWIDAHGMLVRSHSVHMIGIGIDITELKKSEIALRESERRYRNLFENATYGIFVSKADGSLLDVNPALVTMLGYDSKQELLQKNLNTDIYEDPAVRQSLIAHCDGSGRVNGRELNWKRKDGRVIRVRLSGGAIRGNDNRLSHFEVTVEDITEQRSLEEQLRHSQKMEAVGLLAGGISHDFRNLLVVILGNAELLLEKMQPGPLLRHVQAIKKAGSSASQLIRQLLAFSRKQELNATVLDLNSIVREVGQILHRLIGEDIQVAMELHEGRACIRADAGQIEQVLMNLATNARDAMPDGGTLTIRTQNVKLGTNEASRCGLAPGGYVHLSVSDTGSGMTEETRNRVFEPFFTTKEKGRGTGLGLATVYGIIKQSGGSISVASKPAAGTNFDIYLPQADESHTSTDAQTKNSARGTETILVLEDEDDVRQVTRELLMRRGYKVLQAARCDTAIDLASQYKDSIPLLISDVVLPDMNGPCAASKLKALHPEMKIIYVSGYTDVPLTEQLIADGAVLMQKPVLQTDLLRKVDELLHVQTTGQA